MRDIWEDESILSFIVNGDFMEASRENHNNIAHEHLVLPGLHVVLRRFPMTDVLIKCFRTRTRRGGGQLADKTKSSSN